MYIIRFERILQTRSENSEKQGKSSFIFYLSSEVRKNTFTGLKILQNCIFLFPPLFQTIVDKSLETLLHFWGVFQFTQVQPLPSPHKQCWTRVSRIFFRGSTLYKVEGGITARKFRKGLTALRGNRKMTEKYKCCSNVPRTFVHNCSIRTSTRSNCVIHYTCINFATHAQFGANTTEGV